jgi:hypothetical protein
MPKPTPYVTPRAQTDLDTQLRAEALQAGRPEPESYDIPASKYTPAYKLKGPMVDKVERRVDGGTRKHQKNGWLKGK